MKLFLLCGPDTATAWRDHPICGENERRIYEGAPIRVRGLASVLCALYASEINIVHGFVAVKTFANAELDKAAQWLAEQASLHYLESDFARRFLQYRSTEEESSSTRKKNARPAL